VSMPCCMPCAGMRPRASGSGSARLVPTILREAIADLDHELGSVGGRVKRPPSHRTANGTRT